MNRLPSRHIAGCHLAAKRLCVGVSLFFLVAAVLMAGEKAAVTELSDSPGNTLYCIDPVRGNDAAKGTREAPWKSFQPLDRLRLAAGDRVEVLRPGSLTATLNPKGGGTRKNPVVIRFAPGRYDWLPDGLLRRKLMISNVNDDPEGEKAIAMELCQVRHMHIEGPRAVFFCRGKMMQVHLEKAVNVRLAGFAFDYARPTVSEYAVEKVGSGEAVLKVHPDSAYRIDDGRLTWVGEGWEASPDDYGQKVTLKPLASIRCASPLGKVDSVVELKPGRLKASFAENPGFEEGAVYQHREIFRDYAGSFCDRSQNIVWDGVRIHFMHGMAIVSQFTRNIAFVNVKLAPRPESGRTCASWADFLHFSGCAGKIVIDGVHFNGGNDDGVNIHGTHLRLVDVPSPRTARVRFMHPQTFGFMAFQPGDEVDFIHRASMLSYGGAKVVAAKMDGDKEMMLTFDRDVPEGREEDDVLENATWTPEVTIRNCVLENIPCRGLLLTTRRPIVVENNVFRRMGMRGILISDDASTWYESGMVKDVTIRKNTFEYCGEPVIEVLPENTDVRENRPVHRNIRMLNNTFRLSGKNAIALKSASDIVVKGNKFYVSGQERVGDEELVTRQAVDKIRISGNSVSNK